MNYLLPCLVGLFSFLFPAEKIFCQKNTHALPESLAETLANCSFQIEQILPSHDNQYLALSGIRKCSDKSYREVMLLPSGSWINNTSTNTFLTENTAPVEIKWIGEKLYVYQPHMKKVLLKNELVFDKVVVVYFRKKKSFY